MSEAGYTYGRGGAGVARGQRWTNWRDVTGRNGENRGQVRYNGRRVEYQRGGATGSTYGGRMQTAAARSVSNNTTNRVNNRLNRRR